MVSLKCLRHEHRNAKCVYINLYMCVCCRALVYKYNHSERIEIDKTNERKKNSDKTTTIVYFIHTTVHIRVIMTYERKVIIHIRKTIQTLSNTRIKFNFSFVLFFLALFFLLKCCLATHNLLGSRRRSFCFARRCVGKQLHHVHMMELRIICG